MLWLLPWLLAAPHRAHGCVRPSSPASNRDCTSEAVVGGEIRGRSFKHCQVSATGGKQVQRQQGVLKVFDILPGGLPNACKCFKGGIPFLCAWTCFRGAPISAMFQRPLLSKNSTSSPPRAENISKQIPSWLTAAEEVWSAAYSPPTGPSVK